MSGQKSNIKDIGPSGRLPETKARIWLTTSPFFYCLLPLQGNSQGQVNASWKKGNLFITFEDKALVFQKCQQSRLFGNSLGFPLQKQPFIFFFSKMNILAKKWTFLPVRATQTNKVNKQTNKQITSKQNILQILACETDLCRGQQHRHLLSLDMIGQGCKYLANISKQKSTNIQILNSMRKDEAYMRYLVDFFSDFFRLVAF